MSFGIDVINSTFTHLHNQSRALQIVWSAAIIWTIVWAIFLALQGLLPVATVYLSRLLVDSLVLAAGSRGDWGQVRPTLILAGLMVGVLVLAEVLQSVAEWVR